MAEDIEDEDDAGLLNNEEGDDRLISAGDRPPSVRAVFVVTFDVKYGNTIEFQMPEKERMSLAGVEYKAIPSGAHHIHEDFVYFRHEQKYGFACLAREDTRRTSADGVAVSTLDPSQRGMRIKSVGILTSSIIHIQSYLQFLETEAKTYLTQLAPNFTRLRSLLTRQNQFHSVPPSVYDDLFNVFLDHFGPSIFPLSRLILLNKRILLYSSTPIGPLCNAVYFTHMLNRSVNPLFFITIMELSSLTTPQSYIACTTEKIYREKTNVYDVFIGCEKSIVFHTHDPILQSIVKLTRHDQNRMKKSMTFNAFTNIGLQLSQVMDRASQAPTNHQLTKDDFLSLDLHQRSDRLFVSEYLRIHQVPHVTISNPHANLFPFAPCCPCPSGN